MIARESQLSADTFIAWLDRRALEVGGWRPLEQILDMPESSLSRLHKQKSVSFEMVDRVCTGLGWHPIEVYGDEW